MTFKIQVKNNELLEPGTYPAVLRSVEEKETQFGDRLLWLFETSDRGVEIPGFTSRSSSPQSNAYLWATTLSPDITSKKSWGPEDVVGQECTLVVGIYDGPKGKKNKVLEVRPAPKGEVA